MFATAFVLRSSITTTIFFFAIFSLSNGVDNDYTVCSTRTSCRSLDSIEYPFWGGSRPKYCGLPDFVLKCDDKVNENPLIGTPWGTAYVRSINTSTHHITIAWKRTTYCWMIGTEFNVSAPLSFKLIPDDTENLTLFYGCDNSTLEYQNNGFFQCSDSEGDRRGAVLYLSELSEEIKEETKLSCKNFSVPVLKRELDKLNNGSETLLDILSKGVELEYVMNFTACSACQSSGGSCGSPDSLSSSNLCVTAQMDLILYGVQIQGKVAAWLDIIGGSWPHLTTRQSELKHIFVGYPVGKKGWKVYDCQTRRYLWE